MALQVWLPLDGDLKNYGIGTISNIRNNGVLDNNGKIGKCYGCSKEHLIECDYACPTSDKFSIAMWLKIPSTHSNNTVWETMFMFSALNNSTIATYSYSWASYQNLKIFNTQDHQNWWLSAPVMGGYDKWIHLTVTNEDNTQTLYINGQFYATKTNANKLSIRSGRLQLGAAETADFGHFYFNDVRIYDHCLSPKEVKEISKGLVLHYRLSGVGGENLARNTSTTYSSPYSSFSGVINICPSVATVNVPNVSIGDKVHVHLEYKYDNIVAASDQTAKCWLQGAGNVTGWNSGTFGSPSQFTLSGSGTQIFDYNFVINASHLENQYWSVNIRHDYIQSGSVQWKNFKVEVGDKATPWLPNPADTLYSTLGLNNNIEYDCSGYKHNGTKVGTIVCDSDTPRYSTSYRFIDNTESNKINLGSSNIVSLFQNSNPFSVSFWVKRDIAFTENKYSCIFNIGAPATDGQLHILFRENGAFAFAFYSDDYNTTWNLNSHVGQWYNFVCVYDGSVQKIYINGELFGSRTAGILNVTNSNAQALHYSGYSFKDKISDLRIYSTALSDSDIKELYNSGAWVTQNAAAAYELREE